MDIETLVRESQAEKLTGPLQFKTAVGKERFLTQIRLFANQTESLKRRQATIRAIRESCKDRGKQDDIEDCFEQISKLEPELNIFFTKSDVEKDSYEQLTFSGWQWAKILNTVPYVLLILSYFKLYAVPALALMTPLFMLIMPYIALRYWYDVPITYEQYFHIAASMFGVSTQDPWTPKNIVQGIVTLFSIVQSVVQPIQNAIHLQTIDQDIVKRGEAVEKVSSLFEKLLSLLPFSKDQLARFHTLEDIQSMLGDKHRNFADMWDNSFRLNMALKTIGDIEVLYRLAVFKDLRSVKFVTQNKPCFIIRGGVDPFLSTDVRVPYNISLTPETNHHVILTGPNRGGKSSVLRSTLLSILMAQSFGVAFHTEIMLLRPFDWIATGLRLEDRPGSTSLFEREVEFAVEILKRAKHEKSSCGLVLFDELFHSTNPPDGARTARVFLHKLWKQPNIASFISTHVFDLARGAPADVQKLCVPAYENEDGSIKFSYTLKPGICEVSSVNEILKEKGLIE